MGAGPWPATQLMKESVVFFWRVGGRAACGAGILVLIAMAAVCGGACSSDIFVAAFVILSVIHAWSVCFECVCERSNLVIVRGVAVVDLAIACSYPSTCHTHLQ